MLGDHRGVHPQVQAAASEPRDCEQLHDRVELAGRSKISRRQPLDALGEDVGGPHPRPEGEPRQQAELLRRVAAPEVERGVGFGVALRLRLTERRLERRTLFGHASEDVVRRAVQDAVQRGHPVRGQRLAQEAHDGHPTAHRALEAQRDTLVRRQRKQLLAPLGEQQLVGRDHRLAQLEGLRDQAPRGLDSAHQLDHHLDRRVANHGVCVGHDCSSRQAQRSLPSDVPHRGARDRQSNAALPLDRLAALLEQPDESRPHVAEAQQAYRERGGGRLCRPTGGGRRPQHPIAHCGVLGL